MAPELEQLKNTILYSEELGIDLSEHQYQELFKWFLASTLFGNRISEDIAKRTYQSLEHYNLLTPKRIVKAGWDYLVNPVMREGGYVRYDGKTSTQLLKNSKYIIDEYQGSLNNLHKKAADNKDLEKLIDDFYGVGPVTTNIFLRELRPYWLKCDPDPLPVVQKLAQKYKIDLSVYNRKSLIFIRIEAGLIRMRHEL
ncbi:MAG TPA: hypothetical protein VJ991_15040 [Balneolales bacterium]|nr:hypothetical protein [Balneolales bacterium]